MKVYGFLPVLLQSKGDGSVVTWGNPGQGGDSKAVQEELRNVRHTVQFSVYGLWFPEELSNVRHAVCVLGPVGFRVARRAA